LPGCGLIFFADEKISAFAQGVTARVRSRAFSQIISHPKLRLTLLDCPDRLEHAEKSAPCPHTTL
jgi:hypothetical protein